MNGGTRIRIRPRVRRRLFHHLAIALAALTGGMFVALAFDRADLRTRVSAATAWVALGCVALSLMLGPLNLVRARPNPVSSDLRRDLGVWGGVVGLVHLGIGLTVHMRGKMLQYFLPPPASRGLLPFRVDAFGAANDLGLVSGLILLMLVLLSSDLSLRVLGTPRWKWWQRMNYVGALAMVGHGVLYQAIERRPFVLVALFAAVVGVTLTLQGIGVGIVRRRIR